MAFKQATVNASDIPSTQSNFPAYVDLSRLGITTLAEAQSVRCYADESKVTELAREIVSVTEMHVKIPSLTSTFVLYVEYDGVSSDYAVTDTYGRNAVWSDYIAVYHYNDDPGSGSLTDATGNGHTATAVGSMTSGDLVDGAIGKAWDFDGSDDRVEISGTSGVAPFWLGDVSVTSLSKLKTTGTNFFPWAIGTLASAYSKWSLRETLLYRRTSATVGPHITLTTALNADTNWKHLAYTGKTGDHNTYLNGADNGNDTDSRTMLGMTTPNVVVFGGAFPYNGGWGNVSAMYQDELRWRSGQLSSDWIETESNNQSDESTFWGTWSDVSASSTPKNPLFFGGGL